MPCYHLCSATPRGNRPRRVRKYPIALTGEPVAAYLDLHPFGALLRNEFGPHSHPPCTNRRLSACVYRAYCLPSSHLMCIIISPPEYGVKLKIGEFVLFFSYDRYHYLALYNE